MCGKPFYDSGIVLGKLVLTDYLCEYLVRPDFRWEVLCILGYGESVAQSGALALLTNIAMAWNTHHMDRVHQAWRQEEPDEFDRKGG